MSSPSTGVIHVLRVKTLFTIKLIFRHYDHLQLYIQNQIRYCAKILSLMNHHHICLLIPSDWLKVLPRRQHQHQSLCSVRV